MRLFDRLFGRKIANPLRLRKVRVYSDKQKELIRTLVKKSAALPFKPKTPPEYLKDSSNRKKRLYRKMLEEQRLAEYI